MEIQQIIEKLGLEPHPEGGFFKEVYRSTGEIDQGSLSEDFIGKRNYSTSIYFMLTSDTFSAFHRIHQDEIWHFYKGSPIRLHCLSPDGIHEEFIIGSDLENGQVPQLIVPAGYWFAAEVLEENTFALVGCTVSPGFDFRDFELAEREKLAEAYPDHKTLIEQFTRE
ncbi:cupin domain-containing protein [Echinicola marina]|uniref:cupin domain-containing protein n=1 Tax=Echinicola marina TaxID=2859768 RepID=UPI001CF6BA5B|nr:cupin domain-containing protein [Echinicola marina]UCS94572.1 cupin domain-containing protein [Echinicola marina]